MVFKPFKRK